MLGGGAGKGGVGESLRLRAAAGGGGAILPAGAFVSELRRLKKDMALRSAPAIGAGAALGMGGASGAFSGVSLSDAGRVIFGATALGFLPVSWRVTPDSTGDSPSPPSLRRDEKAAAGGACSGSGCFGSGALFSSISGAFSGAENSSVTGGSTAASLFDVSSDLVSVGAVGTGFGSVTGSGIRATPVTLTASLSRSTGLSAALHLAKFGISVAVVEAQEVGFGGYLRPSKLKEE